MKSFVAYVRNLLGWSDEDPAITTSFKRDRTDDDVLSDEAPALKRLEQLRRTNFPDIMSSNDTWERKEKNVRYVPIQVDAGHPSTSTPIEVTCSGSRVRSVPVKLVDLTGNGPSTPSRKPRMHTPVRPVMHAVVDDDDDDDDDDNEEEVTWVETKSGKSKKPSEEVIELEDDDQDREDQENDVILVTWVETKSGKSKKPSEEVIELEDDDQDREDQENDVIFVKKVSDSTSAKPFKFFTKNDRRESTNDDTYYRLIRQLNDRNASLSTRSYTKFKAPAGIMKTYKKSAIPRWMQPQKPSNAAYARSRLLNVNGRVSNIRSTLSDIFNLDEKRNYQELIKRVAGTTKPVSFVKPLDIINIAEDSASFRNTQKAERRSLNEIRFVEKGLAAEREGEASREYDPITVASINSSDSELEVVPSESSTSSSVRIDPITFTLKDSYRYKDITSTDGLAKIDSKYRKKRQETQEKLKDARRESDIISKVNYEQKLAHLEHKLKYELSIPESLIEEAQPTVELPELTQEQERLVKKALGPGPPGQLLVEKFNLRIHRRDLQTLAGLNWLNDEVINFYMNLLMQRSGERPDLPRVYAANTFFYPKLMQGGQAGLRRWTRKVDIFAHDLMVVPGHLGVHWCLSLVDLRSKRIQYLDSMGGRNQPCLEALLQYLRDEHRDKKGQPFDDDGWKLECLSKDIPQQMNGSDCGMFACTFAEFSARDAPYTFSQTHIPYLRRKAALEILTGKLLL